MIEFFPVKAACKPLGRCKVRGAVKHAPKLHPSSLLHPASIAARTSTLRAVPCAREGNGLRPLQGHPWVSPGRSEGSTVLGMPGGIYSICGGGQGMYWLNEIPLPVYYSGSYKKKLMFQCAASQTATVPTRRRVSNSTFRCLALVRHFSCN